MGTIPPQFAVSIPARTSHSIHLPRALSMRTIYLRSGLVRRLRECSVVHVSPLLRELIVKAFALRRLRLRNRLECALRDLIIDELERASPMSTFVTLPGDRSAWTGCVRRAAQAHAPCRGSSSASLVPYSIRGAGRFA
jgi:hypothetical protein